MNFIIDETMSSDGNDAESSGSAIASLNNGTMNRVAIVVDNSSVESITQKKSPSKKTKNCRRMGTKVAATARKQQSLNESINNAYQIPLPKQKGDGLQIHRNQVNLRTDTLMGRRGFNSTLFSELIQEWTPRYEQTKQSLRRFVAIGCMKTMLEKGCRFLIPLTSVDEKVLVNFSTPKHKRDCACTYVLQINSEKIAEKIVRSFRCNILQRQTKEQQYGKIDIDEVKSDFLEQSKLIDLKRNPCHSDIHLPSLQSFTSGDYDERASVPATLARVHSLYCPGDDDPDTNNLKAGATSWTPENFWEDAQVVPDSEVDERPQIVSREPTYANRHHHLYSPSVSPDTVDTLFIAPSEIASQSWQVETASLYIGKEKLHNQVETDLSETRYDIPNMQFHSPHQYMRRKCCKTEDSETNNLKSNETNVVSSSGKRNYQESSIMSFDADVGSTQCSPIQPLSNNSDDPYPMDYMYSTEPNSRFVSGGRVKEVKKAASTLNGNLEGQKPNVLGHSNKASFQTHSVKQMPFFPSPTQTIRAPDRVLPAIVSAQKSTSKFDILDDDRLNDRVTTNTCREQMNFSSYGSGCVPAMRHRLSLNDLSSRFEEVERRATELNRTNKTLLERITQLESQFKNHPYDREDLTSCKLRKPASNRKKRNVNESRKKQGKPLPKPQPPPFKKQKKVSITKKTLKRLEERQSKQNYKPTGLAVEQKGLVSCPKPSGNGLLSCESFSALSSSAQSIADGISGEADDVLSPSDTSSIPRRVTLEDGRRVTANMWEV